MTLELCNNESKWQEKKKILYYKPWLQRKKRE